MVVLKKQKKDRILKNPVFFLSNKKSHATCAGDALTLALRGLRTLGLATVN